LKFPHSYIEVTMCLISWNHNTRRTPTSAHTWKHMLKAIVIKFQWLRDFFNATLHVYLILDKSIILLKQVLFKPRHSNIGIDMEPFCYHVNQRHQINSNYSIVFILTSYSKVISLIQKWYYYYCVSSGW
jgi:hypothetical protein